MNKFEILWCCKSDLDIPNLDHFVKHNPDVVYHKTTYKEECDKLWMWRNSDTMIREWWKEHRDTFNAEYLFVLEYDVLITKKINIIFQRGFSCCSLRMMGDKWKWFAEYKKLNGINPIGAVPLAVTAFSRDALDNLIDPKWDELYSKDIFSELRLASIMGACGVRINILKGMSGIKYNKNDNITGPGYYHSVKHKIQ
jgi:hypothetical protein